MTEFDPFHIKNPEHSKAIFSELNGSAEYYKISSSTPFKFYVGVTVPKLETCKRLNYFSFDISLYEKVSAAGYQESKSSGNESTTILR